MGNLSLDPAGGIIWSGRMTSLDVGHPCGSLNQKELASPLSKLKFPFEKGSQRRMYPLILEIGIPLHLAKSLI